MKNKKQPDNEPCLKELRYEKKFVISEMSLSEIESLIKHNPTIFSEIFYKRKVNNIYLDSLSLDNYNENVAGVSQRLKIRIRWYGNTFGMIKNPFLELKIKNNELGKKLSFQLVNFNLNKNLSQEFLKKIFLKSNLPDWLTEKLRLYYPTLINSYKRKYFLSCNKKYRITLDNDLVFYKIKNNSFNEKIENKTDCILEIKCFFKDYDGISNISSYFPFRLIAHSKYVRGIDLLG